MIHIDIPAKIALRPIAPLVRINAAIPARVDMPPTQLRTDSAPPGPSCIVEDASACDSPGVFGAMRHPPATNSGSANRRMAIVLCISDND